MHSSQRFSRFLLLKPTRCAALPGPSCDVWVGGQRLVESSTHSLKNATRHFRRCDSCPCGSCREMGWEDEWVCWRGGGECKWKWERVVWAPPTIVVFSAARTHALLSPSLSHSISFYLSLSCSCFLWRWHPLDLRLLRPRPRPTVRHFSFVPWASQRVVFCCVVCVIYVTRNANTWVNMQNISQTMICTHSYVCVFVPVCVCVGVCVAVCVQMGSLAIVCRHDMCASLMQRPKRSRSSNKPHMNGIHFDRLRRLHLNRGQMTVCALRGMR